MDLNNNTKILNCPGCDSSMRQNLMFVRNEETFAQCGQCDLVYVRNKYDNLDQIYNGDYFDESSSFGYSAYKEEWLTHKSTFTRRLKALLTGYLNGKPIYHLDVGCAFGHLVKVANSLGRLRSWGCDISKEALEVVVNENRVPAFKDYGELKGLKGDRFDLVTLYDVLEHTQSPRQLISRIYQVLSPGGVLHITTPNYDSWSRKILQDNWYHYKTREHVLYFTPNSLRKLLEAQGFFVEYARPDMSYMTIYDIVTRLQKYHKKIFSTLADWITQLGLGQIVVPIPIGEMDVIAIKPGDIVNASDKKSPAFECQTCEVGEINLKTGACNHCDQQYCLEKGVLDLYYREEHQDKITA